MKVFGCAIFLLIISILNLSAQGKEFPCKACDYLVESNVIDGDKLGVKPGQIICLISLHVYDRITFKNIIGSPEKPVIIRNCGGIASVYSKSSFGIKFQHSKDFRLIGDGASNKYGIKITTEKGFYLTLESFTTNFEISHIEIAGPESPTSEKGFAGIGVKTSPYEDCELFSDPDRDAWIMRDISIHDNYIHDVGGEGLYIGHGFYKGRIESKCSNNEKVYSHSIRGLRVYNNLIEKVGYDGIQIKNADQDVLVYDNIVRNFGLKNHPAHNEGLFIGEGSTGEYYANIIVSGSGNACQIQGMGNIDIHDNLFMNAGENGIYATNGKFVVRLPDGYFNIHNNSIFNVKEYGLVFHNNDGGNKIFSENLVISKSPYKKSCVAILNDNGFIQSGQKDFQKLHHGPQGINLRYALDKIQSYLSQNPMP